MHYTEEHFDRMESDPVLRRQYFWQVGQSALLRSVQYRKEGRLEDAQRDAWFGRWVLDNIERLMGE